MELVGRSILAYFTRHDQAERAKAELRRAGFETVQVDRLGTDEAGAHRLHNPLTGRIESLADLTLGVDTGGGDAGPLLAADPDTSGLAHELDADPGAPAPAWIVTVVTTEDQVNRAVHILEDAGGIV
ncbi:MAG TPA: hypothetical protein VIK93_09975 [Limnochordales bacterium]